MESLLFFCNKLLYRLIGTLVKHTYSYRCSRSTIQPSLNVLPNHPRIELMATFSSSHLRFSHRVLDILACRNLTSDIPWNHNWTIYRHFPEFSSNSRKRLSPYFDSLAYDLIVFCDHTHVLLRVFILSFVLIIELLR